MWETPRIVRLVGGQQVAAGYSGDNIDLDAYDDPVGRYS